MAVPCVKNHYWRTYLDEFMLTCLRGASFFETQYSNSRNVVVIAVVFIVVVIPI